MDYARYQVEDFLMDTAFVDWVKNPDAQSDAFWHSFLQENPEQQRNIQQAKAALLSLQFDEEPVTDATVDTEWARFRRNQATEPERDVPIIPLRSSLSWWWAAATVAGLLVGLFWWLGRSPDDTLYITAYGQLRTVRLPDGSSVILNANSEIRLPGDWTDRTDREVWLKGEGFFRVVKRPGRTQTRFVVHTDELAVEVLGTSFNVRSRRRQVDVQLQTGSVRLQLTEADTARSLLMKPGDGVSYRPVTGELKRRLITPNRMGIWTQGVLLLDRMTLRELGQIIEETYGRRVVIRSPALARRVLNGSLPTRNEQALLEGIAITLNVPVRLDNNAIIFGE